MYTPVNPSFTKQKWGLVGSLLYRRFCDGKNKVREKSRECHNHKPQPFPDTKRKSDQSALCRTVTGRIWIDKGATSSYGHRRL